MRDLYGREFQAGEQEWPAGYFFLQATGCGFGQAELTLDEARLLQERLRLFVQRFTVEDSDVVSV